MPFDAQGNFSRVMNWQEDAANDISILASRHDAEDDNFAAGFNDTVCRDGRATMTGNLKMGSNKITGLANGTNANDAVNKGQLDSVASVKQNTITGGASSITSSNLTVNKALISDGSGKVAVSTTTDTELGYVHGVTSALQTQLNDKTGIPNYSARTEFTTTSYTPANNGIIRILAQGKFPYVSISFGNFIIARSESTDSASGTEAVWAIVKAGETYTIDYNGTDNHKFFFIPFV